MKRRTLPVLLAVLVAAGLAAGATGLFLLRPRLPAAERGRRLAERTGCFACHGPEGSRGAANPGRTDRTVPTFGGDLMMYAESPADVREWILNGVTSRRARSRSWQAQRDRGALRMPAFKGRLSARELDDLVAFVLSVSGEPEPEDSSAALGLRRAQELGCVGCHGPGGRLARPNPGSLKGYVPSWDGSDFPELVAGRAEFDQWVREGVPDRFRDNALARWFLARAALKMPAYRHHLQAGDLDALWTYVQWLRSQPRP
ncbi:MAG: c-type cytochrome [Candidatus Eisenbacteria bacterium]|nr:c-type cytochrome [Candidatus Eisenbacteria bacterium]